MICRFKSKFAYKSNNYSLRQNNRLTLPKPNTQKCKRTFLYLGSQLYDELPMHIRQSSSLAIFNKNIKCLI